MVSTDRLAEPSDVVRGPDPSIKVTTQNVTAYRHGCGACGYTVLSEEPSAAHALVEHLLFGHPAARNPKMTCHAAPMWDHERWCVRAKDHDGDHWTPSFNGGATWPNRKAS